MSRAGAEEESLVSLLQAASSAAAPRIKTVTTPVLFIIRLSNEKMGYRQDQGCVTSRNFGLFSADKVRLCAGVIALMSRHDCRVKVERRREYQDVKICDTKGNGASNAQERCVSH